jgi:two-component system chemotaxis sensor kinase CheA
MNKQDEILDFSEFNEDCYAECEEHFVIIRRDLLALEKMMATQQFDQNIIQELFRSYHTLKGLTGMIGQSQAEKLAHLQESFLKSLDKGNGTLSEQTLDALFQGVKAMEAMVSALRKNIQPPDMTDLIKELSLLGTKDQQAQPPEKQETSTGQIPAEAPATPSTDATGSTFLLSFIPDKELFAKGINVNSIRGAIEKVGKIIKTEPVVQEGGKVQFNFTVSANLPPEEIEKAMEGKVLVKQISRNSPEAPAPEREPLKKSPASSMQADTAKSHLVRVDLNRLDDIMKMIGDLVISRSRLEETVKSMDGKISLQEHRLLQENVQLIERQLRSLREGVMRVRLVPIGDAFDRMQFVVRDLIKESRKKIQLELKGKETEIDKAMVEKMLDPLLHLVRNAVSHGLEMPDQRTAKGKPEMGHIYLSAHTSGDSVIIEIEDDGKGIDKEKVLLTAINKGIIEPKDSLSDAELLDIICSQGFSTREEADRTSGRGVGMAVVKNTIQELGGSIRLDTRAGQGTKFTIQLPITLAIIDALIVEVKDQKFAMPQSLISEVMKVESDELVQLESSEMMQYRHGVIPVIRLSEFFHLRQKEKSGGFVMVMGSARQPVGIMTDKILNLKEIVVRPLATQLNYLKGISGASELGDNKVLLILDPAEIIKSDSIRKQNTIKSSLKNEEAVS